MKHRSCRFVTVVALLVILVVSHTASAQKSAGVLRTYDPDSPGGMSIMEEATVLAIRPMASVFSGLVTFDQHVPQNSFASIVPDLATSWRRTPGRTTLTFALRHGIKWKAVIHRHATDRPCLSDS
jgi:peptide/nickel transport system substrate-binding protein